MTRIARLLSMGSLIALVAALTVACSGTATADVSITPSKTFGAPPGLRDTAITLKTLFDQRKIAEAHALCQQGFAAVADDETKAFYLRYDGEAYMNEGSPKCVEVLEQVIEQFPQTIQVPWAKLDLGEVYTLGSSGQNVGLAVPVLDDFIKTYPQHEKIVRAYWLRGQCKETLGDDAAALANYQQAVAQYPGFANSDLCVKRAMDLLHKAGRWNEALAAMSEYRVLFPHRADAMAYQWLEGGVSYARNGDFVSATKEFDKALICHAADDPARADILYRIAATLLGLKRYDDTHSYLGLIVANATPSLATWRDAAQYLDGVTYYQAGDYAQALAALRRVVSTSSRQADREAAQSLIRDIEAKSSAGQ